MKEDVLRWVLEIDAEKALALIAILLFGGGVMRKVFSHMKQGFGTYNLRVVGIIVVATFASILAVLTPSSQSAAIGILGAIAGYLFGFDVENRNRDN